MPRAPRHPDVPGPHVRPGAAVTFSEADVRSALLDHAGLAGWSATRFVDADRAERSGRPVVAVATTLPWDAWLDAQPERGRGLELRPYGVRHHTLLVGARWVDAAGVQVTDPYHEAS